MWKCDWVKNWAMTVSALYWPRNRRLKSGALYVIESTCKIQTSGGDDVNWEIDILEVAENNLWRE